MQRVRILVQRVNQSPHVLGEGHGGVVASSDRVSGGDDGAAGLEGGDDAGLGDRDSLLLHGLVDTGPVLVIHLGVGGSGEQMGSLWVGCTQDTNHWFE